MLLRTFIDYSANFITPKITISKAAALFNIKRRLFTRVCVCVLLYRFLRGHLLKREKNKFSYSVYKIYFMYIIIRIVFNNYPGGLSAGPAP